MGIIDKTFHKGVYSENWSERQNAIKTTDDIKLLQKIYLLFVTTFITLIARIMAVPVNNPS